MTRRRRTSQSAVINLQNAQNVTTPEITSRGKLVKTVFTNWVLVTSLTNEANQILLDAQRAGHTVFPINTAQCLIAVPNGNEYKRFVEFGINDILFPFDVTTEQANMTYMNTRGGKIWCYPTIAEQSKLWPEIITTSPKVETKAQRLAYLFGVAAGTFRNRPVYLFKPDTEQDYFTQTTGLLSCSDFDDCSTWATWNGLTVCVCGDGQLAVISPDGESIIWGNQ